MKQLNETIDAADLLEDLNEPDSKESHREARSVVKETSDTTMWDNFKKNLVDTKKNGKKGKQVYCRIDDDLAYTLDECRIEHASRSEMISAIVRAFMTSNLNHFKEFRLHRPSLLDKGNVASNL